jgi:cysteine desulfurase
MKNVYLDHAAATPLDPQVYEAIQPYLQEQFANPSSLYTAARHTRQAVNDARATVANVLGAKPTEIIWTSGGTEGDNLAIQGVLRAHPGTHWVTTAIEHDAILSAVGPLRRQGFGAAVVPVRPSGVVEVVEIERAITDQTVLISVMLANNEIGTIQPVADVAKMVAHIRQDRAKRGIKLPLYVHTDATQAANYLDLHVTRLGVDLLSLNGSKIYGPKGSGLLYVRQGTTLEPLFYGGGQERGRRSGTESVAGIVGLAKALEIAQATREDEGRRLRDLRNATTTKLLQMLPESVLNGDPFRRLPNNINLTLPGAEGEGLVLYLDKAGIQASTGSACSSGDLDPSHVLLAIGRTAEQANDSLRLTLGRATGQAALDYLVEQLPPIVERLRHIGRP